MNSVSSRLDETGRYVDIVSFDWSDLISNQNIHLSFPTQTDTQVIVAGNSTITGIVSAVEYTGPGTTSPPNYNLITVNNVNETYQTRTTDFIGLSMFEALSNLSDQTLCDFYVDPHKDLNWFLRGSRVNPNPITTQECLGYQYTQGAYLCNDAKVYGAQNRNESQANLDAWSDALGGWSPQGSSGQGQIVALPGTCDMSYSTGWTENTVLGYASENQHVTTWNNVTEQWYTIGSQPWLTNTGSNNYVYFSANGETMANWNFSPLAFPSTVNVGALSFASGTMTAYLTTSFSPIFSNQWNIDFSSGNTHTIFPANSYGIDGTHGKLVQDGTYDGVECYAQQDIFGDCTFPVDSVPNTYSTAHLKHYLGIKMPDYHQAGGYQAGDEVGLTSFLDEQGHVICQLAYQAQGSGTNLTGWIPKIYQGYRESGGAVNSGPAIYWTEGQSYNWVHSIWIYNVGSGNQIVIQLSVQGWNVSGSSTSSSSVSLYIPGTTTGRINKIRYGFDWNGVPQSHVPIATQANGWTDWTQMGIFSGGAQQSYTQSFFPAKSAHIQVYFWANFGTTYAQAQDIVINDYDWNSQSGNNWIVKSCNASSYLTTSGNPQSDLNNYINMKLVSANVLNWSSSNGGAFGVSYATFTVTAGGLIQGNPWVVNTGLSPTGTWIDIAAQANSIGNFTNFFGTNGNLLNLTSVDSIYLDLWISNTIPSSSATLVVDVYNPQQTSWFNAGTITVAYNTIPTEFSLSLSQLNTSPNYGIQIETSKIILQKTNTSGNLHIYLMELAVSGNIASNAYLSLNNAIVEAGNYSICLEQFGSSNSGTLVSSMTLSLTQNGTMILCQNYANPQGLTEFVFASYIESDVSSSQAGPQANLATFTVTLWDQNGNNMTSVAANVYPGFVLSTPSAASPPQMKVITLEVGDNSVGDGIFSGSSNFDWTTVSTISFNLTVTTDIYSGGNPYPADSRMFIDWVHFESGRWFAEEMLPATHPLVQKYGRATQEFFDESCFSTADCDARAKTQLQKFQVPVDSVNEVIVWFAGMEQYNPGDWVTFALYEGTVAARIVEVDWSWNGALTGTMQVDNEGLQPIETLMNIVANPGFEAGTLSWTMGPNASVDGSLVHTGTLSLDLSPPGLWSNTASASQSLGPTPVRNIQTIQFYVAGVQSDVESWGNFYFIATYSDETASTFLVPVNSSSWTLFDYSSSLNPSKTLVEIEFYAVGVTAGSFDNQWHVDDVSVIAWEA
jgi:hypothetical protein